MKIPIKSDVSIANAGLTVFVMLALTIYCRVVHFSLIIPLLLLFLGIHLFFFRKASLKLFLHLGLLLAVIAFITNYLSVEHPDIPSLYIPVASIAMLTMLLFNDLHLAFIMSFLSSVIVALLLGGDLNIMLTFFMGNLTAAYSVRDARTRGTLITAGIYVGIIQVISMILLHPEIRFMISKDFALNYLRPLCVNGIISAFVVMGTLKIFEYWFGVLTNFSLLELSDKDHPLLKRMRQEAPGTYIHSMSVSDLAEAAANSIGANPLLTRIGAYYHDVGKMLKPEYFTENQLIGGNKHDNIEPSISRLVIMNHVKEGMELARKYKLNPRIIDFIPQHHGTSLMYFFYQKALEESEDPESVKEENYRYPGPKPQTREAAILLLADSVEGATRALDEPNPQRVGETVRKIINNKFIDGQLDDCNLSLREIDLIASTFTRVLNAMHHGRVKYPEKKNGNTHENRNRKSAEENPPSARPDQKNNQNDS